MKAGRELDALVAEKIFGLEVIDYAAVGRPDKWYKKDGALVVVPAYSTHIACAWQVIDQMFSYGRDSEIQLYDACEVNPPYKGRKYRATFAMIDMQETAVVEFALTAPHAICLASLRSLGVQLDKPKG